MDVLVTSDSRLGRSLIQQAVTRLGHRVVDTDTAGAGAVLANQAWRADVMIAGLMGGRSSRQRFGAVGVEIGIALERGLPILVVSKSTYALAFLAGIPRVDYADDEELLVAQLDLLLQALADGSPRDPAPRTRRSVSVSPGSPGEQAINQAMAFEARVGELLRSVGGADAILYSNVALPDVGEVDFALHMPGSAFGPGVVLVEVKAISEGRSRAAQKEVLARAAKGLSQRVRASGSSLGLLVHQGDPSLSPSAPMTIAITIDELERTLSSEPLGGYLRRARNEAVHSL